MRIRRKPSVGTLLVPWLAACAAAGFAACGGGQERAAQTAAENSAAPGPEMERSLGDAHRALIAAFENRDVDAFVALLDAGDQTLVFHPLMENRFDGPQKFREGATRMFAKMDDVTWTDVHPTMMIYGDMAWLTSEILVTWSATTEPFVGRGTEIWILRDGSWRLIHGHWSRHAKLGG